MGQIIFKGSRYNLKTPLQYFLVTYGFKNLIICIPEQSIAKYDLGGVMCSIHEYYHLPYINEMMDNNI